MNCRISHHPSLSVHQETRGIQSNLNQLPLLPQELWTPLLITLLISNTLLVWGMGVIRFCVAINTIAFVACCLLLVCYTLFSFWLCFFFFSFLSYTLFCLVLLSYTLHTTSYLGRLGTQYTEYFLFTYRYFMSGDQLLEKLRDRYLHQYNYTSIFFYLL